MEKANEAVNNRGRHGLTASPRQGLLVRKIDMAFFGWFWLIVDSRNILPLRRPLHVNSSASEVEECMEAFVYESFYLMLLFIICCSLHANLSFVAPHETNNEIEASLGPSTVQSYLPGTNILHIFILHAQVIKMGITPSSHN